MSRITQKPAVAPLNPWANLSSGNAEQAFSAIPANGSMPSSGTGFYDPGFVSYVGQKFETSDGRELALVQNGAVAITAGKYVQAQTQVVGFQKLAITVPTATPATAGTFQVLVTNGATVLNANQYAQGYLITASATGAGQILKISSHQPAAASATFLVTLEDPIQTTLDATTTVSIVANNYIGILVGNHTTLGTPVGITLYGLAASTAATFNGTSGVLTANGTAQYGLIVTKGQTAALIDSTVTNVGYPLGPSAATDGALGVATLTSSPEVAISGQTQTSAQYGMVVANF